MYITGIQTTRLCHTLPLHAVRDPSSISSCKGARPSSCGERTDLSSLSHCTALLDPQCEQTSRCRVRNEMPAPQLLCPAATPASARTSLPARGLRSWGETRHCPCEPFALPLYHFYRCCKEVLTGKRVARRLEHGGQPGLRGMGMLEGGGGTGLGG